MIPSFSQNHLTCRQSSSCHNQSGVALLTVLLLVVAITILAGSMLASQKINLRQYELLLTQDQVLQDIRSAEQFAVALIKADADVNDSDSLQDAWSSQNTTGFRGAHRINLIVKDESARFNLNNLYHDDQPDEVAIKALQRLLMQNGLDEKLAYAILDWQDPDSQTSSEGGAEADAYSNNGAMTTVRSNQNVTANIANQPFLSVDELMSVQGFSPNDVEKLRPYLTAVPYYLPININTADNVVLSALVEGATTSQFSDFSKQRQTDPIDSVDNAISAAPWNEFSADTIETIRPMLDVQSQAFKVLIKVTVIDNDSPQSEPKYRYATTYISKTYVENTDAQTSDANKTDDKALPNNSQSGDVNNEDTSITAFGTRLWSYRPNF